MASRLYFESPDATKLAFVKRCIDMGIAWQNENCNQASLQKAMDILAGKTGGSLSGKWAKFTTGDLKRGILEIVESLSDIRPYWGYSTDNKSFREQSDMMSKVAKSIYMESFVDRAIKDALQYAAVSGAGFIYPFYSRTMFGAGDGEFQFMALGQPDVLPVQLPRGKNYQNAYIVTLAIPMGVAEAHARFPEFQAFLKPFAKRKYGRTKGGDAQRSYDSNRWRMHKIEGRTEQYTDVYFTYILDVRINYGEIDEKGNPILDEKGNAVGKEMPMGQPGTSWYYTVPYVGQQITRFENGQTVERVATEDDCRVYPQRRLMISSDLALMYDGPGFDWHSMVPIVPFYLDEWAWEDTGYSLFNGTAATQDAIDDLMRSIYRVAMARAKPGKVYNMDISTGDKTGKLTSRQAEAMDPFDPDTTWGSMATSLSLFCGLRCLSGATTCHRGCLKSSSYCRTRFSASWGMTRFRHSKSSAAMYPIQRSCWTQRVQRSWARPARWSAASVTWRRCSSSSSSSTSRLGR